MWCVVCTTLKSHVYQLTHPTTCGCPGGFAAAVRARERRGRGGAGGRVPAAAPAPAGLPRARRCLRACAGRPPRARTSALLNINHRHECNRLKLCVIVPRRLRAAAMQVRTSASHAFLLEVHKCAGALLCARAGRPASGAHTCSAMQTVCKQSRYETTWATQCGRLWTRTCSALQVCCAGRTATVSNLQQ